tara:strand:- start:444 stop:647 length:204 start_codon:yes stop_codon:yes gene_type:complete
MNFETRHIGSAGGRPASILELTVIGADYSATEDILNFKTDKVDENFIMELRQLADELQEHNDLVDSK